MQWNRSRKDGLVRAVELACELLGIEFTAERRAHLHDLDAPRLEALVDQLRVQRRWP